MYFQDFHTKCLSRCIKGQEQELHQECKDSLYSPALFLLHLPLDACTCGRSGFATCFCNLAHHPRLPVFARILTLVDQRHQIRITLLASESFHFSSIEQRVVLNDIPSLTEIWLIIERAPFLFQRCCCLESKLCCLTTHCSQGIFQLQLSRPQQL